MIEMIETSKIINSLAITSDNYLINKLELENIVGG